MRPLALSAHRLEPNAARFPLLGAPTGQGGPACFRLKPDAWLAGFCTLAFAAVAAVPSTGSGRAHRAAAIDGLLERNAPGFAALREAGHLALVARARVQADIARDGEAADPVLLRHWSEIFARASARCASGKAATRGRAQPAAERRVAA